MSAHDPQRLGAALVVGLETPTEEWKAMMDVHVWSHLAGARAMISHIKRRGGHPLNPR